MSKGHFEQDRYWVSPYNFVPEVREGLNLPPRVQIHDATLRDGEQTPGVVMTKDDKIAIATKLSEVGIERIEAGMPAVSPQDAEAIRGEISALKLPRTFSPSPARCGRTSTWRWNAVPTAW